jgi:hypothetical protein
VNSVVTDQPELRWLGTPTNGLGIAVLFHGGVREHAIANRWQSLPYLSIQPFGWAIRCRSRFRIAVALIYNPAGGWVAHAGRVAADEVVNSIHQDYPDSPIALIGHSSGGWVALTVGGQAGVTDVVALSPWLALGQPTAPLRGRQVLLAHGVEDHVTSPHMSAAFVERLHADHVRARYIPRNRTNHALFPRRNWWHLGVARYVVAALTDKAQT